MNEAKPFAESCEENKAPILAVLKGLLKDCKSLLEIGSGTGQHAVHFAAAMPQLIWQTSDLVSSHPGIQAWLDEAALPNTRYPLELDAEGEWPTEYYDAVFSANVVHIMSWSAVVACFAGVGKVLSKDGLLLLYGPFNYAGEYTSESNRRFDGWLKSRDPQSGIRDFDDLQILAVANGLVFSEDIEMPVNNRILVWRKAA
jgi:cyclopropane fatty-acyl-phospholipid synthase-like methyltransferase